MRIFGIEITTALKAVIAFIKRMRPGFEKFIKEYGDTIENIVVEYYNQNRDKKVSELEGIAFEALRSQVPAFIPDTQLKIAILQAFDIAKRKLEE
jgi:hypothetical protein